MEIIIRDTNAFRNYIESNGIVFQLNAKKTFRSYLILYVIGILLVLLGFSNISSSEISSDYTNYLTKEHTVTKKHYPINVFGSLGFGLLAVSTYFLILNKTGKSRYEEGVSRLGKLTYSIENLKTTIIRDDSISVESPITKFIYKWIIFNSYSLYKNYLILNIGETVAEYILVNKNLIPDETYQELMDFIKTRMKEKRI